MTEFENWFHELADEGKAISVKREELLSMGINLPTWRIEFCIELETLKKRYYDRSKKT